MNEIKPEVNVPIWNKFKVRDSIEVAGVNSELWIKDIRFYKRDENQIFADDSKNPNRDWDFIVVKIYVVAVDENDAIIFYKSPKNESEMKSNRQFMSAKVIQTESLSLKNLTEQIQISQYQIYCDMDGVLTNFKDQYEHFTGKQPEEMEAELVRQYGDKKGKEAFWNKVDHLGPAFWANLPWMKDGHMLWNYIQEYNPKLLSSPSRSKTSVEGKKQWVDKYLSGSELILRQAGQKREFACPKCILIDDREDTIQGWIADGGIGIVHTSAANTIRELEKLGFGNQLNEIKPQVDQGIINDLDEFTDYFSNKIVDGSIVSEWNKFKNNYNYFIKKNIFPKQMLYTLSMNYEEVIDELIRGGKLPEWIEITEKNIPNKWIREAGVNLDSVAFDDNLINQVLQDEEIEKLIKSLMYRFNAEILRNGKSVLVDKNNYKSITPEEVKHFCLNTPEVKEVFFMTARKYINENTFRHIIFEKLKEYGDGIDIDVRNIKRNKEWDYLLRNDIKSLLKEKSEHRFKEWLDNEGLYDTEILYMTYEDIINDENFISDLMTNLSNIEGKELNESLNEIKPQVDTLQPWRKFKRGDKVKFYTNKWIEGTVAQIKWYSTDYVIDSGTWEDREIPDDIITMSIGVVGEYYYYVDYHLYPKNDLEIDDNKIFKTLQKINPNLNEIKPQIEAKPWKNFKEGDRIEHNGRVFTVWGFDFYKTINYNNDVADKEVSESGDWDYTTMNCEQENGKLVGLEEFQYWRNISQSPDWAIQQNEKFESIKKIK